MGDCYQQLMTKLYACYLPDEYEYTYHLIKQCYLQGLLTQLEFNELCEKCKTWKGIWKR